MSCALSRSLIRSASATARSEELGGAGCIGVSLGLEVDGVVTLGVVDDVTLGVVDTPCAFAFLGAKSATALQYNLPSPMSHGALVLVFSTSWPAIAFDFLSAASLISNSLRATSCSCRALSCAACISHTVISRSLLYESAVVF